MTFCYLRNTLIPYGKGHVTWERKGGRSGLSLHSLLIFRDRAWNGAIDGGLVDFSCFTCFRGLIGGVCDLFLVLSHHRLPSCTFGPSRRSPPTCARLRCRHVPRSTCTRCSARSVSQENSSRTSTPRNAKSPPQSTCSSSSRWPAWASTLSPSTSSSRSIRNNSK